jgi:hypothetical protein
VVVVVVVVVRSKRVDEGGVALQGWGDGVQGGSYTNTVQYYYYHFTKPPVTVCNSSGDLKNVLTKPLCLSIINKH